MNTELPRTVKTATLWLLLGTVVFVAIQAWQHEQTQLRFHAEGSAIEIQRGPDGHYHWPGRINGHRVDFLVDTGATGTAISSQLARELRLEKLGQVESSTAGGTVIGAVLNANLELQGGVRADNLHIVALPRLGDQPLLGMDVLGRLHWQQRDGVMRIELGGEASH